MGKSTKCPNYFVRVWNAGQNNLEHFHFWGARTEQSPRPFSELLKGEIWKSLRDFQLCE